MGLNTIFINQNHLFLPSGHKLNHNQCLMRDNASYKVVLIPTNAVILADLPVFSFGQF